MIFKILEVIALFGILLLFMLLWREHILFQGFDNLIIQCSMLKIGRPMWGPSQLKLSIGAYRKSGFLININPKCV